LTIVERDLKDAKVAGLSDDRRFEAAFSAARTNATSYDSAGNVSKQELDLALKTAAELRRDVIAWLQTHHRDLLRN